MDLHELESVLEMQNRTQLLLLKLREEQDRCKGLLSLTSSRSDLPMSESKVWHENESLSDAYDSESLQTASVPRPKLKSQVIHDALLGKPKMSSYRKVSPENDKPGRRHFRLAQGIVSQPDSDYQSSEITRERRRCYWDDDQKENYVNSSETHDGLTSGISERLNSSVTFDDDINTGKVDEVSLASTPKKIPRLTYESPKSILKRRKIIDDNVKVQSQYNLTPGSSFVDTGLNYSYSEVDDDYIAPLSVQSEKDHDAFKTTGEESSRADVDENIEQLMRERLLLDAGNDRKNAGLVMDLSHRPKSYIFAPANDPEEPAEKVTQPPLQKNPTNGGTQEAEPQKLPLPSTQRDKMWKSRDQPLLGYDWIAGNLENKDSVFGLTDDYFNDIRRFRESNKQACSGEALNRGKLDLTRPITPEIQDPAHQCLHGFTVNERLFTEPMNPDDKGQSACPVCLISRPEPSQLQPGFVRVSIPRSTLEKPYRVKPHRRRSFDATDTYALSKHCQAGYECTLPTTIPTAKNIDLKGANGIQGFQTMSLQDAENFVRSHSRTSRILSSAPQGLDMSMAPTVVTTETDINATRDLTNTTLNSTASTARSQGQVSAKTTDNLLNLSHSLRYDLQDLARRKGKDSHKAPHSTDYPLL